MRCELVTGGQTCALPIFGGRAESCGEIESDFAGRQSIEDNGCKGRETQPAFDEADGQSEPARDIFRRGTSINKGSERLRFIGWVHSEAMEVFGQARFDCDFRIVLKHEAGKDRKSTRLNSSH